MRLLVINGPNLDLLGTRQPEVYGAGTLSDLETHLIAFGKELGVEVEVSQSNHEGEIVETIHRAHADGLVINPGALSHTSRAIADALHAVGLPAVEVHISNVRERESWRALSVISDACVATIYGRGIEGYANAIRHLVNRAALPLQTVRYGPHPDNVGDLRLGQSGMVVLVHGGVWRQQYRRDTIESLAVDLTQRGYHTWNIEYRTFGTGGGWPGSGHDVLTALDHTPQLDLEGPLTVIGHSAGGYLAMWSAPRSRAEVALCVGLAPVMDLEDAVASGEVLAHESGLLLDAGAPSPVSPGKVPTIVVHGTRDDIVPVRHSTALARREGIEILEIDAGHFELIDPARPHWEWVIDHLS